MSLLSDRSTRWEKPEQRRRAKLRAVATEIWVPGYPAALSPWKSRPPKLRASGSELAKCRHRRSTVRHRLCDSWRPVAGDTSRHAAVSCAMRSARMAMGGRRSIAAVERGRQLAGRRLRKGARMGHGRGASVVGWQWGRIIDSTTIGNPTKVFVLKLFISSSICDTSSIVFLN